MSTAFRCVFRARPAKALPRAGKGKGRPPCALRAGLGPSAAWRAHRAEALTSRGRKAGAPAGGLCLLAVHLAAFAFCAEGKGEGWAPARRPIAAGYEEGGKEGGGGPSKAARP